ncbi:putative membrane protein, partial [Escherichia coli FRIK1985]
MFSSG